jgi:hypothetical protein
MISLRQRGTFLSLVFRVLAFTTPKHEIPVDREFRSAEGGKVFLATTT